MENRNTAVTIRLVLAALFAGCLFDMSYGYYQLVRFVGMAGFAILAGMDFRANKAWAVVWAFSALMINPFFKVALGRELWNLVDIAWIILLIVPLLKGLSQRKAPLILFATTFMACGPASEKAAPTREDSNPPVIQDIDGNTYRTVVIDSVVWMAENLQTTRFANGDSIEKVDSEARWKTLSTAALSTYENDSSFANRLGRLYNWWAVSDIRNICPQGWHVPTEEEWDHLFTHLGGAEEAGAKMKTTGTYLWCRPNEGASNSSGFAGLPGGLRSISGSYSSIGTLGCWWSITENGSYNAQGAYVEYEYTDATMEAWHKRHGLSCRCVQD